MGGFDQFLFDQQRFDRAASSSSGGPLPDISSLTIGGVEWKGSVLVNGFSLSMEINGAIPTFSFSLRLPSGEPEVDVGDEVILYDRDGEKLFRGMIVQMSPRKLNSSETLWAVFCQHISTNLETAITGNEVFTNVDDSEILNLLFSTYLPSVDATTYVSTVATIPSIDLSGKTLRQCLEEIQATTQAVYYEDNDYRLHYFAPGARQAEFGLSESAVSGTLEYGCGILRGNDFRYIRDFSSPCNRFTVRNMVAETPETTQYQPSASGDNGSVSRDSSAEEYPPTGAYTVSTSETTMVARRRKTNPYSSSDYFYPTVTSDCGFVSRNGYSWPPTGSYDVRPYGSIIVSKQKITDGPYYISVGLARFNTSPLPSDAEILEAKLVFTPSTLSHYDWGAGIAGEWYSSSNWPIDSGDWTSAFSDSAFDAIDIDTMSAENPVEAVLKNPSSYVDRAGMTGIRLHIYLPGGSPTGSNSVGIPEGNISLYISYQWGGTSYTISLPLVRFDTSSLADTAVISGASLRLYVTSLGNADDAELGIEYYAGTNWPIDSGDWTNAPAQTAYAYRKLSTISSPGWLEVPLLSPDANISRTGYTGFRIHIRTVAAPTGDNYLTFATQEDSSHKPLLEVTGVPGLMISGTYEDTHSQVVYGVKEGSKIHPTLVSQEEAELIAQSEVMQRAWPRHSLTVSIRQSGLHIGEMVQFQFPSAGIDSLFLIRRIAMTAIGKNLLMFTIDAGDFRDDLVQYLRQTALRASAKSSL